MTCTLYKNFSDSRKIDKELSLLKDVTIILKNENNILNPTIFIKNEDFDISTNYIYIDKFNRYYYVDNVITNNGNLVTLDCSVDVLTSFKDKILEIVATVDRNENLSNGYLQDGNYKAYAYNQIVCKSFPNGLNSDSLILMTVG